ncbi:uncharacterized protein EHS24_001598 [Apiotrichum porosum]|uniref:Uncharacterized protein n=1 Tax=Apiotrichum porosum TaxID=105984 RepID=A0A427XIT9_9TREE|nr:uncharacterized protein EHS24_001598 [Apiotrichum porosum]RSH78702.1 hypothetical protein EHS24_001598 [Apiotrichum porosum]
MTQDNSPRIGAASTPSGSPSLSSNGTGANTPAVAPVLSPIITDLSRDSSTSTTSNALEQPPLRLQTSMGRIPRQASVDALRPRTPSDLGPNGSSDSSDSRTNGSDSRTNSPRPSTLGLPSSRSLPRPGSMSSLPTRPYSMPRSSSGAPHQGRSVQLTMPRPLSVSTNLAEPISPVSSHGGRPSWQQTAGQRESYHATRSYTCSEFGQVQVAPTSPRSQHNSHRRQTSALSLSGTGNEVYEEPQQIDPMRERQVHGIV